MSSMLLSWAVKRYSIVRRSRSVAIVPATIAGPSISTAISWTNEKAPKKPAVRLAATARSVTPGPTAGELM